MSRLIYTIESEDGCDFQHIVKFVGIDPESAEAGELLRELCDSISASDDVTDLIDVEVQYAADEHSKPIVWRKP